ncbi:glycosyltransferase family 4 protein [Cognatishimia maritima]|uniref:Glycosyltransferase involved in cell wall bisynthesis n=1 Tax=Cognatishimia maritima TaxID=870908 RepID=A0A1M5WE86_9RHOB|nr:glycosyltransferase family 4 protein [Cognatishimia maritima]SHH85534.1 Glycosyltransferase involved in cell wall bisynthesis [Cognatishimia maritima]
MAKKRVLQIVRRLDVPRGAERLVADLVRTQDNHDVLVFDGSGSFYDLGTGQLIQVQGFAQALWYCLRNRHQYDLFHLHMVPACYLAFFLRQRAILHVHSAHYPRRKRHLVRLLDWGLHRIARSTITVSAEASDGMRAFIGDVPRMYTLPNFVPEVAPVTKPITTETGITRILMVASLDRPKRQDILIKALEYLPQYFVVTLAGVGAHEQSLRDLAKNLGLADRVVFLGAVKDIASAYASADICALISDWEGFGLVVLEAAQLGKVTVVTDVPGLRESCPDPRLIVQDPTPEAVAKKIVETVELKDDAALSDVLKSHAAKHSIGNYVTQLDKLYDL